MTTEGIIVNACVALMLLFGFARNRYVAAGKLRPVYWLMILGNIASIVLNTVVVKERPEYFALYLFNLLTAHSLWSAYRGLRRLNAYDRP